MAYNGSGSFSPDSSYFPVVSGALIESAKFNGTVNDIATGLSNAITKDGQTTVTSDIPLSGYKITGAGNGVADTDYATVGQLAASAPILLSGVAGTNTITATATPAPASYVAGRNYSFIAANNVTGSTTININGLGAKAITTKGGLSLLTGNILADMLCLIQYDGTQFQLLNPAALLTSGGSVASTLNFAPTKIVASASTTALGSEASNNVDISGTTTITSFGTVAEGVTKWGRFTGALTLTHNATSLILPGGANITTAANDGYYARSLGSGNWIVLLYSRASGLPMINPTVASASESAAGIIEIATASEIATGTDTARAIVPAYAHMAPSAAKAWVVFDGTGATGSVTPLASQGVTSVTKNGTGNYTITFNFTFASVYYAPSFFAQDNNDSGGMVCTRYSTDTKTTTAFQFRATEATGGALTDSAYICLTFHGYR